MMKLTLKPKKRFFSSGKWNQYLAGAISSLSFAVCSAAYVWVNPVLTRLLSRNSPVPGLEATGVGLVASLAEVGSVGSPVFAGYLADKFGRRTVLLVTAPIQAVIWASVYFIHDKYTLFVVRTIQGLILGGICTILPLYLSEVADKNTRGQLGVMSSLGWNFGIVYEFAFGPFVPYNSLLWANAALPMIFFVTFFWFYESPYYLVKSGRTKEAYESLLSFRDESWPVEEELAEIQESIAAQNKEEASWKDLIFTKSGRVGLWVVIVINVTFNMCGAMSIISFSTATFEKITGKHLDSNLFTLFMAIVLTGIPLVTALVIDRYGRKPTLLISYLGSTLCLFPVCLFFLLEKYTGVRQTSWSWLPVGGLMLYPTLINFGAMIVAHTYQAELFPVSTRGLASAVATIIGAAMASLTLQLYEMMEKDGLDYVTYSIYTAFALAGFIFSFSAPETKGKTFEEIQRDLSQ